MTLRECLHQAQEKIAGVVSGSARLDAEILLAYVLEKPRSYLHAWPETTLSSAQIQQFTDCVSRRCHHEPIAYITGKREFWSLNIEVNADTLIPRPETELLVETILKLIGEKNTCKLADLGTGSGAIALALAHERPTWQIYATDCSEKALQIASKNAQRLALNNISFYRGSWCTVIPERDMDVIVSNPPYIAETEWEVYAQGLCFEPRQALISGQDGLDAIRTIIQSAKYYLKQHGYLLIEHGYTQAVAVREAFAAAGYSDVFSVNDMAEKERVTVGRFLNGNF